MNHRFVWAAFFLFSVWDARAEEARVLPQGRSRMSFIYGATAGIREIFNASGGRESITAPYNLELNAKTLQAFSSDLQTLVQVLNDTGLHFDWQARNDTDQGVTLNSSDPLLGDALSAGALNVDAQAERQQYNIAYQYGVSDRLTVGFMVPIVQSRVRVSSSIQGQNTARYIARAFETSGGGSGFPVADYLQQVASLTTESFQGVLTERGYERFENTGSSGLGDALIGARYNYFSGRTGLGDCVVSFQSGLSIPTGKLKSPSQLAGMDFGSGFFELGNAHIANLSPVPWLMLSHSLYYTQRFQGSRSLRVRASPTDFLPDAASEERLTIYPGNKAWTSLGARVSPSSVLSLEVSYEFYWKGSDRYAGARADRDYGYLEAGTDVYGETLQIGAAISSIQSFLDSRFPLPGTLSLNYYQPIRGRNQPVVAYGTLELSLYF